MIADNCAIYVNQVFADYGNLGGSTLFLAVFLFAFQIYCDFSGYSDIAIGVSRLFGFNLRKNFAFPYFSRDISEFWRRWHISLSTWFRDYVYIPLGGSRVGHLLKVRNVFAIFLLSGIWHGANWTFFFWGFLNALYFLPLMLASKNRVYLDNVASGKIFPKLRELRQMLITFLLTLIAWVFFRSETIRDALVFLKRIFSSSLFSSPELISRRILILFFVLAVFIVVEWFSRGKEHVLELRSRRMPRPFLWGVYLAILFAIVLFAGAGQEFIYFQF